ncbi:gamma carbonic anhydrase family protein [Marinivivus vitaminiproducens]|uniref:gamma carbonic anhydrase family protein n=1 Tax=Marinivivus vitaminiproducens TaxID=3035935 RepID=UPI00279D6A47|nr:gamma carbonic anhydrase family protein [Geminicoccaceae bacterium SCSIO 64248]
MTTRYRLDGKGLRTATDSFWIAPNATLIGDVVLENDASVWWGCVVRGDNDTITVGEGSNVQDLSCLHTDVGLPLTIGRNVTVGHMAMLHGCRIGDGCLIGIGAIILNGAVIGDGAVIGAGSLVPEGKEIPPGSLVMGRPAKVVREVDDALRERVLSGTEHYVHNWKRYAAGLEPEN